MGTYTLENFRSELLFDLRNRTDTAATDGFSVTRQDSFINAGYLHVTHPTIFRHRELETVVAIALLNGTSTYTFTPLAGVVVTAVRYASHVSGLTDLLTNQRQKLVPRDEQWFQDRTHQSGAPRDYMVRGSSILLSPVPGVNEVGEILAVGAWREPAVLVAGQTTVLSTIWDEIILLAARWRAELHLGYRDLAEATKVDFTSLLNEYKSFDDLHAEDWDWMVEVRTGDSTMERA